MNTPMLPAVTPGKFLNEAWLKPLPAGDLWEIVDHAFCYARGVSGYNVAVPVGFVSDGASIPRALRNVLSPTGPWFQAALLHDLLYTVQPMSKSDSDLVLLEGMVALGVDEGRRGTIYEAVRLFGLGSWNRHTEILNQIKNEQPNLSGDPLAVAASHVSFDVPAAA